MVVISICYDDDDYPWWERIVYRNRERIQASIFPHSDRPYKMSIAPRSSIETLTEIYK